MKYKISENLIERLIDDELITLNLNNSCYYGFKDTAIDIFNFIKSNAPVDKQKIIEYILDNYDIDFNTVNSDISNLLDELARENIIEPV